MAPVGYADGPNLYAYAGNDPVNRTDPSGLSNLPYIGSSAPGTHHFRRTTCPSGFCFQFTNETATQYRGGYVAPAGAPLSGGSPPPHTMPDDEGDKIVVTAQRTVRASLERRPPAHIAFIDGLTRMAAFSAGAGGATGNDVSPTAPEPNYINDPCIRGRELVRLGQFIQLGGTAAGAYAAIAILLSGGTASGPALAVGGAAALAGVVGTAAVVIGTELQAQNNCQG